MALNPTALKPLKGGKNHRIIRLRTDLLRRTVVLSCENQDQFEEMIADYADTYQPGSPGKKDLFPEMAPCRWRILRLRMMETALMDSEMQRELPEPETSTD